MSVSTGLERVKDRGGRPREDQARGQGRRYRTQRHYGVKVTETQELVVC